MPRENFSRAAPPPDDKKCFACGKKFPRNNSIHALQCLFCRLWAHRECTQLDEKTYDWFAEMAGRGGASWVCDPCRSFGQKLGGQVAENTREIKRVGDRVEEIAARVGDVESRMSEAEGRAPAAAVNMDVCTKNVFAEMQRVATRKNNIIIHGAKSAPASMATAAERKRFDLFLVKDIMATIGLDVDSIDIKFMKRLSKRDERVDDAPLQVGLRSSEAKEDIMANAKYLVNTKYESVSISHDLTNIQRELENDLRREALEKNQSNEALPAEERRPFKWKVTGRVGERRVTAIPDGRARPDPHLSGPRDRLARPLAAAAATRTTQRRLVAATPNEARRLGQLARQFQAGPVASTPADSLSRSRTSLPPPETLPTRSSKRRRTSSGRPATAPATPAGAPAERAAAGRAAAERVVEDESGMEDEDDIDDIQRAVISAMHVEASLGEDN